MRKILALALAAILLFSLFSCAEKSGGMTESAPTVYKSGEVVTLNVYNWGEYISDGSEDSYDSNAEFEEYFNSTLSAKYGGITVKVNYTTYANNEEMYSKLKNSAVVYDIVVPSDYMIEKMIDEDMLLAFDPSTLPNYENIIESFRTEPFYDRQAMYSVPYTYGMLGIIYDADVVDEEDIDNSWELLFNPKYAGKILQFNNPRDAFATAMYLLGLDVNSDDPADWEAAYDKLAEQKPILQGYVNDEIFNKMTSESAAISTYYVGDYLTMVCDAPDANLEFYYPEEGVNYFVDAMCIPKNAKHPDIAKEYINFMLSEDAAVANAEYIGYASPNSLVRDSEDYRTYMEEEYFEEAYDLLYNKTPEKVNAAYDAKFGKDAACYHSFSPEIQLRVNYLWEKLKIADSTKLWVHISAGLIVASVVALAVYTTYIKKKRSRFYRKRDGK